MKRAFIKSFFLLLLPALFTGCQDKFFEEYKINIPVYLSYEDLRNPVKQTANQELKDPGKIYFKDNYLFINENLKGIHIIDNSDPASPENIAFVEIPGNVDIAVKGNILFANSWVDLVVLDISDLNNIQEVNRINDIFPYALPSTGNDYRISDIEEDKGVVIDWEVKEVRKKIEPYYPYPGPYPFLEKWLWRNEVFLSASGSGGSDGASFGVGGSMARFILYDNYLYALDDIKLKLIDISTPEEPVFNSDIYIGWEMETVFIYDDHLFMGAKNGMYIYDLANPASPEQISYFRHFTSCDPVVVDGDYAYVTLNSANALCGRAVNELQIISIVDLSNPSLLRTLPMNSPKGLGIDNETLFICDGDAGLKVYNVSDPYSLGASFITSFEDINTFDVIPVNDILFMIGSDGLFQYDYSDIENIRFLSKIPVTL